MTDDIVTRLRTKYAGQLPIMLEAADEIESLRKELNRESITSNIMRNVAMTPYGDSAKVIEELMADRDKWRRLFIAAYESDATSDEMMNAYRKEKW